MNEAEETSDSNLTPFSKREYYKPKQVLNPGDRDEKSGNDTAPVSETNPASFDWARFNSGFVTFYNSVLSEPIPDEMKTIIEQIEKSEKK